MQGIGVDADQAYLGDQIMTSALKKVDVAVYDTVKAAQDDTFKGGANTIFDVKSGGVGIGKTNAEGAKYEAQIKDSPGQDRLRRDRGHPGHRQVNSGRSRPRSNSGDHQAVRDPGREQRGGLRAAPWRDPRAARGERRGQVDADERPLRTSSARRRTDPAGRGAGLDRLPAAGHRPRHRHGAPALHARAGDDRGREPRARRRAARSGLLLDYKTAGRAGARALAEASASRSIPRRRSRTSASARSSGWRSCARCSAARRCWCSTSRPRC